MKRRTFCQIAAAGAMFSTRQRSFAEARADQRVRPVDEGWPSESAWKRLKDSVGGNLIKVNSPLTAAATNPEKAAALFANIKNPYYIGDNPGLTQTLGWVDAWKSQPSVYAVEARHANDVAAAVNFARDNNLRLVIKGGGHSYQGTSNAADSLLVWTRRRMNDILMHDNFVPANCESRMRPQRAVTLGAGVIWAEAYDQVTTHSGAYVQGGGCTTVGVAGLVQSGGFGSFSRYFGTAASNLLEAEVVTADGQIRTANVATNPDLFWALKGGGGGTFAVMTKLTLRVHQLPEFAGGASLRVKANSDAAYRRLVKRFLLFYRDSLFNRHWGETVTFGGWNVLTVGMIQMGLSDQDAKAAWEPFLEWLEENPSDYQLRPGHYNGSWPARHWWNVKWHQGNEEDPFYYDTRSGVPPNRAWWKVTHNEVGWVLNGYESLWLSESLIKDDHLEKSAEAIFSASRHHRVTLHFNKALARTRPEVIAAVKDTAMNPSVCTSFALAIAVDSQDPAHPDISNHQPDVDKGRRGAEKVSNAMSELRAISSHNAAYLSESNYFEKDFQRSYWGENYARLAQIKAKYDPDGLFFVHNGVGSEQWSADGFSKPSR